MTRAIRWRTSAHSTTHRSTAAGRRSQRAVCGHLCRRSTRFHDQRQTGDSVPTTGSYVDRAWQDSPISYSPGDLVYFANKAPASGTPTDSRAYVCLVANSACAGLQCRMALPAMVHFAGQGDVNSAFFQDLWRAYWNVMVNDPTNAAISTPFDPVAPAITEARMYAGNELFATTVHPERMFRSIYRDSLPANGSPSSPVRTWSSWVRRHRRGQRRAHPRLHRAAGVAAPTDTIKIHTIPLRNNATTAFGGAASRADVFATGLQPSSPKSTPRDLEWGTKRRRTQYRTERPWTQSRRIHRHRAL